MATFEIVGVRHHSPACARLVESRIAETSPTHILVEGPADMNERIDELVLEHVTPIAIYSYRLDESERHTRSRGTWTPFCEYSPEWRALQLGRAVGAEVLFMDLPAWHEAFAECTNRYGEGNLFSHPQWGSLPERHGFDCSDALWDHLFETPLMPEYAELEEQGAQAGAADLGARLEGYFDALRGEDAPSAMDRVREAYMAQWVRWACAEPNASHVLVVCGGYHAPALQRLVAEGQTEARPSVDVPEDALVGSYLVPFDFHRLDSFAGYASGMPSPAYYQAVWEWGERAPEQMMRFAVERLRSKGQLVSAAEHSAARTMAFALAKMRGHESPSRCDTLDAMASTWLKEALETPLPWSERRMLTRGTAPLLVELVDVYSGGRRGALAPETPTPPLVGYVQTLLSELGLTLDPGGRELALDPAVTRDQAAHRALHRLRILDISGIALRELASSERGHERPERWHVREEPSTLPDLIERSVYGADLRQAASARLAERLGPGAELTALVEALLDATLAELDSADLAERAKEAVESESSLGKAGEALATLAAVTRQQRVQNDGVRAELADIVELVYERVTWLLEAAAAVPGRPLDIGEISAVHAWVRAAEAWPDAPIEATLDAASRVARGRDVGFGLRGAAAAALWRLAARSGREGALEQAREVALRACRRVSDEGIADFCIGLLAVAREQVQEEGLIELVDERMMTLDEQAFLSSLPGMRRAFGQLPPREKHGVASQVLALCGDSTTTVREFVAPVDLAGAEQERRVLEQMQKYGLMSSNAGTEP